MITTKHIEAARQSTQPEDGDALEDLMLKQLVATVPADTLFEVKQPVPVRNGKTNVVVVYGQSNALGDANTLYAALAESANGNYKLTDGSTPSVRFNYEAGGSAVFPTALVALTETQQSGYGTTLLTGFLGSTGETGWIGISGGKGATVLASLDEGETPFTRLMQNLQGVNGLGYDSQLALFVLWQGENDNIATTKDAYKTTLRGVLNTLRRSGFKPAVAAVAVSATGTLSTDTYGATLALWEMFQAGEIDLVGPAYDLPFVVNNIHPTGIGQTIMGEKVRRYWEQHQSGRRYMPLHPLSVTDVGLNVLHVKMYVPPGATLRCDALNHTAVTGSGFRGVDTGSTFVAVSAVKVLTEDTLELTLAAELGAIAGTAQLRYALDYKAHAGNGVQGAGNCFADSGDECRLLPGVPLLHWCVPFSFPIVYS